MIIKLSNTILSVIEIIIFITVLTFIVAYLTYFERKIIGYIQARIGPNRVGWKGFGQPFADILKLMSKEIIIPQKADKFLFLLAPINVVVSTLVIWAVIPLSNNIVLANINIGVLFVLTLSSFTVCNIILGGWASNSKYALFGAMRAAAQLISYEVAMSFSVVGVVMLSGDMNLGKIVLAQNRGIWHWFFLPLFPLFFVFCISGFAETNRLPFDVAEGESELVGGFHVEYSGMAFALFFLAEYINMLLISILVVIFFFGGWLSPFQGLPYLQHLFNWVPGVLWVLLKIFLFMFLFFWARATLPRLRYDQIMLLCWKILIPITILWIVIIAVIINLGWL